MSGVDRSVQALSLIIVLNCALYLQYEYRPYNKYQLNNMEMEAIFVSAVTIYCGMFYLTQSIGYEFKTALFVIIIMGNGYFLLYWLYYMSRAIIEFLVNKFSWFKRLLGHKKTFPQYLNADETIIKGVYKDEEAGIVTYTLREKQPKGKESTMPKYNSITDIYIETLNYITENEYPNLNQSQTENN